MRDKTLKIAVRKFDPFESALQKVWTKFKAQTNCDFELEAVAMDLHPLYDSTFKNEGLKKGDWDIAYINTDWLTEAYDKKLVMDLRPFIQANPPEDFEDAWSASLTQMQQFGNEIIGLPFHNGPECLIYRTDLFEDTAEQQNFKKLYGRALEVPTTWSEFMQVAEFFHRPGQNLFGTVFAAYPDGHNTVFDFCLQVWTRGGDIYDAQGNINFVSPQAQAGMEFYRSALQNKNAIHPKCTEFDSVKSGMSFAAGELAMMVNWFGFASMCEVYEHSKVKGKVSVANIPGGKAGEGVSLNAYWMYAIAAGSQHKQLAYDFIRFATTAENDKLLTLEGGTGCRKSSWFNEEVNSHVPYYHKLEALHEHTRALPLLANWAQIAGIIDELMLDVMNTSTPINEILKNAQQKLNSL